MKPSSLLISASVALNAILIVGLVLAQRGELAGFLPAQEFPSSAAGTVTSAANRASSGSAFSLGGNEPWQQIDGDLPALATRLRERGFPPEIVRTIITAEVAKKFAAQRRELLSREIRTPFWKQPVGSRFDAKTMAEFRELNKAQARLVKDILGPEPSDEEFGAVFAQQYGDLPAAKLKQIQQIASDYNDLRGEIYAATNGVMLPEDKSKLALLAKEQRADLEKLLTPQELEEYDLRTSNTASALRSQLAMFDVTEDEFRALFQAARVAEQQLSEAALQRDPVGPVRTALLAKAKSILPPERYVDLTLAIDPGYQNARRITERLQLPTSTAREITVIQQDIQERAKATSRNPDLSPDARRQQLAALQAEATNKLTQALTPTGFEIYQQNGGAWVQAIQSRPATISAAR